MISVEKRGKTAEEAIALALEELGEDRDNVVVEVLDEGSKGLFGLLGSKDARVRVTVKASKSALIRDLLEDIGRALRISLFSKVSESEEFIFVDVTGSEVGMLIGRHGQALDSLQYLLNLAAHKGTDDRRRVILDIEGYRRRREESLRRLAERAAEKVARTGRPVTLEAMPAHERRIVHLALQQNDAVETRSEGEEPFRKIIVSIKR